MSQCYQSSRVMWSFPPSQLLAMIVYGDVNVGLAGSVRSSETIFSFFSGGTLNTPFQAAFTS